MTQSTSSQQLDMSLTEMQGKEMQLLRLYQYVELCSTEFEKALSLSMPYPPPEHPISEPKVKVTKVFENTFNKSFTSFDRDRRNLNGALQNISPL